MQNYSFDKIYNRIGTDSKKWGMLPTNADMNNLNSMWIADMDFAVPPFIIEAVAKRLSHPIFGYFELDENFYEPIKKWQKERFNITDLQDKNISYQTTVLGGFSTALYLFTNSGDKVLCNAPCYTGFINQCDVNKRELVFSTLVEKNNIYTFDFDDMEQKIKEHGIKCAIICAPHNPTGRVWTKEELKQYVDLCEKYNVKIISDEIWADFVFEGKSHIPTHTVSEYAKQNTISCYAPTKTFNLAGFLISYTIIYNDELMKKYSEVSELTHYNCPHSLSVPALQSAYEKGNSWVDDLCAYIKGNLEYSVDFINRELPKIKTKMPESTYLLWLDFSNYGYNSEEIYEKLSKIGLVGDLGTKFNADNHIRLNLACPKEKVVLAMEQLKQALK